MSRRSRCHAGTVEFRLTDPEGKPVPLAGPAPVPRGRRLATSGNQGDSGSSTSPRHWEAEHPCCYTLETILKAKGPCAGPCGARIGFRQTEVAHGQLLINGQPVKIRGTCHHDSHPLLGRAVTS